MGITGDMKGNGLQNGGTFAVDQTGKTLFEHRQVKISDHPKISDILASLGITSSAGCEFLKFHLNITILINYLPP